MAVLATAISPLAAHPMADIVIELKVVDDGIVVIFHHTLSDVFYSEQLLWDPVEGERQLSPFVLELGLTDYQQRVLDGLVIYHRDGRELRATVMEKSGSVPQTSLRYNQLSDHSFVMQLHFASDNPQQELETVVFDFDNWRNGVSTVVSCRYLDMPHLTLPVLWGEGSLYPLFPESTETDVIMGQEFLVVPSLNLAGIGFSTVSIESDHLRHELLLPTNTALTLLAWNEDKPTAHQRLDAAARQRLSSLLLQRSASAEFARYNGRLIAAENQHIRWFDRASLRRGLPVTADQLPVATSFIGLVEIYRPPPGSTTSINLSKWWELAPQLACTLRQGDQVIKHISDMDVLQAVPVTLPESLAHNPIPTVVAQLSTALPWWRYALMIVAIIGVGTAMAWRQARWPSLTLAGGSLVAVIWLPEQGPTWNRDLLEQQLRHAYHSASGQDERRSLQLLQAISSPALAAELHVESRRQLSGPWAVRSGLAIEAISLNELQPTAGNKARASWTVRCRVRHWGHGHNRMVRFDGLIGLATDGRIASIELLDKQLLTATSAPLSGS